MADVTDMQKEVGTVDVDAAMEEQRQWMMKEVAFDGGEVFARLGFPYMFCGEDELDGMRPVKTLEQICALPTITIQIMNENCKGVWCESLKQEQMMFATGPWCRDWRKEAEVQRVFSMEDLLEMSVVAGQTGAEREKLLLRLVNIMSGQDDKYRIWRVTIAAKSLAIEVVRKEIGGGRPLNQAPILGFVTISFPETVDAVLKMIVQAPDSRPPRRKLFYRRQHLPQIGQELFLAEWRHNLGIRSYRYLPECDSVMIEDL